MKAAQAKLRSLVSKKKRRFQEGDFDLDLTYVTDRLIAMGFPSEGGEGIYRNPMGEVVRFFQKKHPDSHRIYNLCSEREYDPQRFSHQVVRYPFDDHNPPTLRLMVECCQDIHTWLNQNPNNVAAIHCKAGKGRTGVMISSFLLFTEQFSTPEEALDAFGKSRTRDGKGVTIPSQRRFVGYFDRLLHDYYCAGLPQIDFNFDGKPIALTRVRFSSLPRFDTEGGCQPYFLVRSFAGKTLYDSRESLGKPKHYKYQQPIEFDLGVNHRAILRAEFKVMFFHQALAGDKEMLHFWLHSEYVPTKEPLVIVKDELDRARKDKEHKRFSPTFEVSLVFEDYIEQQASDPAQALMSDDDIAVSLRRLAEHFQDQKKRVEAEQRTAIELSSHNVKLQHQLRTLQLDHRAAIKAVERLKLEKEGLENDYKLARNLLPAEVRVKLDAQKRSRQQQPVAGHAAASPGGFSPSIGAQSAPSAPQSQALHSMEFQSDDEDDEPGFEGYEMPVPVLPPPAPPGGSGMGSGPRASAAAIIGLPLSPSSGSYRSASQPPTLQQAKDADLDPGNVPGTARKSEAIPLPQLPPPPAPAPAGDGADDVRPRRP